jgi:flagellar protein FlaG
MTDIPSTAPAASVSRPGLSAPSLAAKGPAGGGPASPDHVSSPTLRAPSKPAVAEVDPEVLQQKLQSIVENLNEQVAKNGRDLGFSIDERLNRNVVIVKNSVTGEVVRQIPNEVVLRIGNRIEDLKGILFDEEF